MPRYEGLARPQDPDWPGLIDNIRRKGTPARVYHMELYHDGEVHEALCDRFGLLRGRKRDDLYRAHEKIIEVNRFCGFDYVVAGLVGVDLQFYKVTVADTAALPRTGGRVYQDERFGPIATWEDLERYPWPDVESPAAARDLQWFQENTPEEMCLIGGLTGHLTEEISWLMGLESFCYALYDQRDLVEAIAKKVLDLHRVWVRRLLEFDRVKMIWASDDMGFKTGTLISPDDLRELVLSGHKELAAMSHAAGRPYLLHSCGNLTQIMDDLIDDVEIDAKHSFEDTIEDVRDAKRDYGQRIALLGGIDVDFLCRADEPSIRRRVRETLDVCMPGGGYCLGTGNTVANYIPLDSYLAMIDEGRLYAR